MIGRVDSYGRALIAISIRPSDVAAAREIPAWIDTGFNGELVLPRQQIDDLKLASSGTLKAVLADGSEVALQRFSCLVDWFGEQREVEVIENDGQFPLLGVGLLADRDLRISYRNREVTVE